ncbi:MAG: FAD-binding oxidoreductase [Acaryochloridaceae cyanobacterium RL_2_7]|nr:FAD-binding oxidoreductase [Acaryochloridaceae cyanobacterium RL_2_7]
MVRADGQVAKAGGRVVKNVAGYDLMKLLTGSYGSLGVISEVTLRLYPLPEITQTLLLIGTVPRMAEAVPQILNSSLTPMGVDLLSSRVVDAGGQPDQWGLALRIQGSAASLAQQGDRIQALAAALDLDLHVFSADQHREFWQQVDLQLWPAATQVQAGMVCKFGLLPAQAPAILTKIERYCQTQGIAYWIRLAAGKGSGVIRLQGPPQGKEVEWIEALRSHCQQAQGFLTLLIAPPTIKQAIDVWGYTGNALGAMQQLKHQFDPYQLLNPGRFGRGYLIQAQENELLCTESAEVGQGLKVRFLSGLKS